MVNFYHDLGIIIKHRGTVILSAKWLIDLFGQLITIPDFTKRVRNAFQRVFKLAMFYNGPPFWMKSRVSNRAVTNKNDYIKYLARYLSCVSSAQSTFKGVQWKYIVCTIMFKCSLKGTSHNKKRVETDTYMSAETTNSLCRPIRTHLQILEVKFGP